jgi:hypothetical protein
MSRINVSNLNSVSELSRKEMTETVGGLRVVCGPRLQLVRVRGPFGITLVVPRLVIACRVVR